MGCLSEPGVGDLHICEDAINAELCRLFFGGNICCPPDDSKTKRLATSNMAADCAGVKRWGYITIRNAFSQIENVFLLAYAPV